MVGMHGSTETVVPCSPLCSPALLRMGNKPTLLARKPYKWKMSCVQNDTETRLSQRYCKLTIRSHPESISLKQHMNFLVTQLLIRSSCGPRLLTHHLANETIKETNNAALHHTA